MSDFKWNAHAGLFLRSLLQPGLPKQYTSADTSRVRSHTLGEICIVLFDDSTCVRCPMMEGRRRPLVRSLPAARKRKHSEISYHICRLHSGSSVEDENFASRTCLILRKVFSSRLLLAIPRTPLKILRILQYSTKYTSIHEIRNAMSSIIAIIYFLLIRSPWYTFA